MEDGCWPGIDPIIQFKGRIKEFFLMAFRSLIGCSLTLSTHASPKRKEKQESQGREKKWLQYGTQFFSKKGRCSLWAVEINLLTWCPKWNELHFTVTSKSFLTYIWSVHVRIWQANNAKWVVPALPISTTDSPAALSPLPPPQPSEPSQEGEWLWQDTKVSILTGVCGSISLSVFLLMLNLFQTL